MKRLFLLFLSVLIATAVPTGAFAQSTTSKTSLYSFKSVKLASQNGQDQVTIQTSGAKSFSIQRFDKPDRIVVDIQDTTTGGSRTIQGAGKPVKAVRYAQFTKAVARVVIDLGSEAFYRAEQKDGQLVVSVMKKAAKNMAYYAEGSSATLALSGAKLMDNKQKKLYTEQYDSTGKKYTITFPNNLGSLQSGTVTIKDSFLDTIQIVNDSKLKKTSITFNAKFKLDVQPVSLSGFAGTALRLTKSSTGADRGDDPREPENPQSKPTLDIRFYTENGREVVAIPVAGLSDYHVMRLTNPERLVVDFLNKKLFTKDEKLAVSSEAVSSVRYAQFDTYTSRVVLDMKEHLQYEVKTSSNQLLLYLDKPSYRNVSYENSGDRVGLLMPGAVLTQGEDNLQKLYTEKRDSNGKRYTITFPTALADIGTGTIQIDDGMLEDIKITADTAAKTTSISFNAKEKYTYEIFTRTDETTGEKNTAITILRPDSSSERLVVIDAGHGGHDPGATYAGVKEKDLNLDIALRLNALLKAKNIKTYMTREDDTFVALYERAYIANQLNASLFVSIHNNAYYAKEKGTEVLYYPGGYGKTLAQIMQDALVKNLGTVNRKIKSRPELVVLKATTMPSVLAEVGFVTNDDDRSNLLKESFRQKAAQALCDSIIKGLEGLK